MAISSHQVNGMIGGQQTMFANMANYANQIGPGGSSYGSPQYSQPMMGPNSTYESMPTDIGPGMMGKALAAAPAVGGAALLAGSFIPGAVGSAISRIDPFTAGLRGFGHSSGLMSGVKAGTGFMDTLGAIGTNVGKVASGGVGNIARAGLAGFGGAAMAAALPMAGMFAMQYAGGKMVEGAQFTHQVQNVLGQNFRHLNPAAQNGYGFTRQEGAQIAETVRTMGSKEIMSSPGEMLRVMEQGVKGGMFRAVQDAKQFQTKFKEMVGTLKEVAKTMHTTLEGAMPFLQESRRMGFWTPADVQRAAVTARGAAASAGVSVAEAHQMMGQGAQMARSIGAQGATGAAGMAKSMNLVGWGLRSGSYSEKELSEATGGLEGGQAVSAFAGSMQAGATRFAASGRARWLLAAMANKNMSGLNAGRMQMLTGGHMGIGELRGMAEKGVRGRGAEFVLNEENLRGELLKQGPEAQMGFVKSLIGDKRLYGDDSMSKLITRRLIERNMGKTAKEADLIAKQMRDLPQIMRDKERSIQAQLDQDERERDRQMEHSWEGVKRKAGKWLEHVIGEPMAKLGTEMSQSIGDMWDKASDAMFGRAPKTMRLGGFTSQMTKAVRSAALGNTDIMKQVFAGKDEIEKSLGGGASIQSMIAESLGPVDSSALDKSNVWTKGLRNTGIVSYQGKEDRYSSNSRIDAFRSMGVEETPYAVNEGMIQSRVLTSTGHRLAMRKSDMQSKLDLYKAAAGQEITEAGAKEMGFGSADEARKAIDDAKGDLGGEDYSRAAMRANSTSNNNMSAEQRAKLVSGQIRGGDVEVGEKARMLLHGVGEDQAMYRMLAMQSEGQRTSPNVGFNVMHKVDAAETASGALLAKDLGQLAAQQTSTIHGMAEDLRKGGEFHEEGIAKLLADPTRKSRLNEAMGLMWASTQKDGKPEDAQKARDILNQMASETGTDENDIRQTLLTMSDPKNPGYAAATNKMAVMGDISRRYNTLSADEVVKRRMKREWIGGKEAQSNVISNLDKIMSATDAKQSLGLGSKISTMLQGGQGIQGFMKQAEELQHIAGKASMGDLSDMISALEEQGAPKEIIQTLKAARETKGTVEALGKKKDWSSQGSRLSEILEQAGMQGVKFKTGDIKDLQSGNSSRQMAAKKRLRDAASGASPEQRDVLEGVLAGTAESSISKIAMASGKAGKSASGAAFATRTEDDLFSRDAIKDKKAGDIIGEVGSAKSIHTTLVSSEILLRQICDNTTPGGPAAQSKMPAPSAEPNSSNPATNPNQSKLPS